MIKLIVGTKGSGKTKTLIDMINEATKTSAGNIVVIEKSMKLTTEINHKARLLDVDEYDINGAQMLYGFVAGVLAGNYDITHIFVDATLKIGGRDYEAFALMVDKLNKLSAASHVEITFTVSCSVEELPERLHEMVINK